MQDRTLERWRRDHGFGKPPVSFPKGTGCIVWVGSRGYAIDPCAYFEDFLLEFARRCIQLAINRGACSSAHPLVHWYETHRQAGLAHGEPYDGPGHGATKALLNTFYDLYTVDHNVKLPQRVFHRLFTDASFQGARYELFVFATLIRAGFDLHFEDENDSTITHPECVAQCQLMGTELAVEAKSKHQHGLMGFADGRAKVGANVQSLIRTATQKQVDLPYALFVELNLPAAGDATVAIARAQEINNRMQAAFSGKMVKSLPSLVLVTNNPCVYELASETSSLCELYRYVNENTAIELDPAIWQRLERAVLCWSGYPAEFYDFARSRPS